MDEGSIFILGETSKLLPPRIEEPACHQIDSITVKRGANIVVFGDFCMNANAFTIKSGVHLLYPSFKLTALDIVIERDASLSVSGQSSTVNDVDSLPAGSGGANTFNGGMHASLGGGWYMLDKDGPGCMLPKGQYMKPLLQSGFAGRGTYASNGGSTLEINTVNFKLHGELHADGDDINLTSGQYPTENTASSSAAGSGGSIMVAINTVFEGSGRITANGGSCRIQGIVMFLCLIGFY